MEAKRMVEVEGVCGCLRRRRCCGYILEKRYRVVFQEDVFPKYGTFPLGMSCLSLLFRGMSALMQVSSQWLYQYLLMVV